MNNLFLNSNQFTENQLNILHFLFNYIIPESESFKIPGASILLDCVEGYSEQFINLIDKSLHELEFLKENSSEVILKSKNHHLSIELILEFKKKNIRIFNKLSLNIIIYYYSNYHVLNAIKVKSVPPFPEGNSVHEGDLLLLENVFLREPMYIDIH